MMINASRSVGRFKRSHMAVLAIQLKLKLEQAAFFETTLIFSSDKLSWGFCDLQCRGEDLEILSCLEPTEQEKAWDLTTV